MGDKSARKNTTKTAAAKTLKEKRADKRAKTDRAVTTDAVSAVRNR